MSAPDFKTDAEGRSTPCAGSAAHSEIVEAFVRLHTSWLGATHRRDMNDEMDGLARILGLNPLTLKPLNEKLRH